MKKDYNMFRFYKGEAQNPFNSEKQNAAFMFWGYESLFEERFNDGDFSGPLWIPTNAFDAKDWQTVLDKKPVDKEELFKIWLFNLLLVHLAEKHQSRAIHFSDLYWKTEL